MGEPIELIQFRRSHFNEKARWALDWKRVPHRRTSLLPGPHAARVRRLTGETTVPVLRIGEQVIAGSARIIETLERLKPAPPLYPADPTLRRRALEIQRLFDHEIGPAVRAALFSLLLDHPGYVVRVFADAAPLPVRLLFRAMMPVGRRRIRAAYHLEDAQVVRQAFERTREGLDFVAKQTGAGAHLVGETFSVADLTAASLLALCCNPPDCDMSKPEPIAEGMQRWLAHWADHPGTAWVLRTYREHRPASAEIGALARQTGAL